MVVVFRAFPEPYGCAKAVISGNNKNSTDCFSFSYSKHLHYYWSYLSFTSLRNSSYTIDNGDLLHLANEEIKKILTFEMLDCDWSFVSLEV